MNSRNQSSCRTSGANRKHRKKQNHGARCQKNRARNTNRIQEQRERRQVQISRESNNLGQQLLGGNKKTYRESSRNSGIPETGMK